MPHLEWTDEPPEEQGKYLMRNHLLGTTISVFIQEHGGRLMVEGVPGGSAFPLDHYSSYSEWAGPIPEPE